MTKLPYAGALVTLLVAVLLLTPPGELIDRQGAYADTRGDVFTDAAVPVELEDGLREEPGQVLPRELGNWTGEDDTSWPEVLDDYLAYDSLLVRDYEHPGFYFPAQVMILSARHARAFHDPEICFSVQGGQVETLATKPLPAPEPFGANGTTATGQASQSTTEEARPLAPVGRMHITYPSEDGNGSRAPPKLVYNIYVVERHDAAPDRTTWIRLSMAGVGQNSTEQVEPYLEDLLQRVVPYMFQASGQARTTAQWLQTTYGTPALIVAGLAAAAPVTGEALWRWRRGPGPADPADPADPKDAADQVDPADQRPPEAGTRGPPGREPGP